MIHSQFDCRVRCEMGVGKTKKGLKFTVLPRVDQHARLMGINYQTVSVLYEYFHSHEIGEDKSDKKGPDLYRRKSVMSSEKCLFK